MIATSKCGAKIYPTMCQNPKLTAEKNRVVILGKKTHPKRNSNP